MASFSASPGSSVEHDHPGRPAQLLAVMPAQADTHRLRGERERTGGVGEVRERELQSGKPICVPLASDGRYPARLDAPRRRARRSADRRARARPRRDRRLRPALAGALRSRTSAHRRSSRAAGAAHRAHRIHIGARPGGQADRRRARRGRRSCPRGGLRRAPECGGLRASRPGAAPPHVPHARARCARARLAEPAAARAPTTFCCATGCGRTPTTVASTRARSASSPDGQWRDTNYYAEAKSPVIAEIMARARASRSP